MVSVGDIQHWRPARLEETIRQLKQREDALLRLNDELGQAPPNKGGQCGDAVSRAGERHRHLANRMKTTVAEIALVRCTVARVADEIVEIKRKLSDAEALARKHFARIRPETTSRDSRSVMEDFPLPPDLMSRGVNIAQLLLARFTIAGQVREILARAEGADRELAAVLERVKRDQLDADQAPDLAAAAATGIARAVESPPEGTPAQNARWWRSLPAETQNALRNFPPNWLGNRDGIPAAVRDRANRNRIDDERRALEKQADRVREQIGTENEKHTGPYPAPTYDDKRKLANIEKKLNALDAVQRTLGQGDQQLLLLDTSGEYAKAAVANGDVDTAENVAVLVPGLHASVEQGPRDDIEGFAPTMDDLRTQSETIAGDNGRENTAVVAWFGYETPKRDEIFQGDDSVLANDRAQSGGRDLADFYRGINESRTTDPHLSGIGHSYGSTTLGYAVQERGTGVDNVVLIGSPGVGVGDGSDLKVPAGHSYFVDSANDPVATSGYFGKDPSEMADMTGLSAEYATTSDGQERVQAYGHDLNDEDGYLQRNSTSLYNVGAVVAGEPHLIIPGEGYGREPIRFETPDLDDPR